ncbi:M28 family peptidase [Herbaspirillum sp. RTI4]|uniref:M28 family metallopeptidase n=1 Tax=Herbaspirillum sp. RTI4 TaxID=3048640 RepID=UPI002AB5B603|nr:M28 family peptidase [Herbaspirillum sp. RTI4]MDY7578966.1 M28 family peptidase [Herbaspirillum sp. RTI4]MEA9980897.1 M28 family peptidase [Herbaspirillum sp. RTI4]
MLAAALVTNFALSLDACGAINVINASPANITKTGFLSASRDAAPKANINSQRMSNFVKELASPKYAGRLPGTPGDSLSLAFIVNEFKNIGLLPAQAEGYLQRFSTTILEPDGKSDDNPENPLHGERMATSNVIGIIPGNDRILSKEVIVISAHRDHLGSTPNGIPYPGANDDLSGLAAVMELARAFERQKVAKKPNKRTLMFVAYGAEEQREMGSMYHADHPLPGFPNKNIVLMISIDMIGLGYDKWSTFTQTQLNHYAKTWFDDFDSESNDADDGYSHEYPPDNKTTFSYDTGPFGKLGIKNRVFGQAQGIPTYHQTTDTWESVHIGPAAIFTRTIFDFLWKVDQTPRKLVER